MGDLDCDIFAFKRAYVPFSGPWISGRCDKELMEDLDFIIKTKSDQRDEILQRIADEMKMRLGLSGKWNEQTQKWDWSKNKI